MSSIISIFYIYFVKQKQHKPESNLLKHYFVKIKLLHIKQKQKYSRAFVQHGASVSRSSRSSSDV